MRFIKLVFFRWSRLWSPKHEDMESLYEDTETPYHLSESPPLSQKTPPTFSSVTSGDAGDLKENGRTG